MLQELSNLLDQLESFILQFHALCDKSKLIILHIFSTQSNLSLSQVDGFLNLNHINQFENLMSLSIILGNWSIIEPEIVRNSLLNNRDAIIKLKDYIDYIRHQIFKELMSLSQIQEMAEDFKSFTQIPNNQLIYDLRYLISQILKQRTYNIKQCLNFLN